jgi:hypothetical protein
MFQQTVVNYSGNQTKSETTLFGDSAVLMNTNLGEFSFYSAVRTKDTRKG